jgi:hypothetical protein
VTFLQPPTPTATFARKEEWIRNKYLFHLYREPRGGWLMVKRPHSDKKSTRYWCVVRSSTFAITKDEKSDAAVVELIDGSIIVAVSELKPEGTLVCHSGCCRCVRAVAQVD